MNTLVSVFQDTQRRLWEDERLYRLTSQAVMCTVVFPENISITRVRGVEQSSISVMEKRTLEAARELAGRYPKVAVLNFANAVNPGGGVVFGAEAQEESLCRCSNLYPCLTKPEVMTAFYDYNNQRSPYYSDRMIYSEGVTVFKTDTEVPEYTDDWFQMDVISCPAPNVNDVRLATIGLKRLRGILQSRIRNILTAAELHGVQALVLGAFGCGAFANPPELVAQMFYEFLVEGEFRHAFREVVFAIPSVRIQDRKNVEIFRRVLLGTVDNPLAGSKIAVFGDSISTFAGYHPPYCRVFYDENYCVQAGMYSVEDTWWMRVIRHFDAKLLVNNSSSGCLVSGNDPLAGCGDLRSKQLYSDEGLPDAIFIYMGINDFGQGVPPMAPDRDKREYTDRYFREAYARMLWQLRGRYPRAELYCATLVPAGIHGQDTFPYEPFGVHLDVYNRIIRDCARRYGCVLIDLREQGICYDSMDGTHPTAEGMRELAGGWIRALEEEYGMQTEPAEKRKRPSRDVLLYVLYGIAGLLIVAILLLLVLLFTL